jgi:hypothetical protein
VDDVKTLKNMNLTELQERARQLQLSDEGTRAQIRTRIEEHENPPVEDPLAALARAWESRVDEAEAVLSSTESHAEEIHEAVQLTPAERAQELGVYISDQWTDEQILSMVDAYETALADAAVAPVITVPRDDAAHLGYDHELASPRG